MDNIDDKMINLLIQKVDLESKRVDSLCKLAEMMENFAIRTEALEKIGDILKTVSEGSIKVQMTHGKVLENLISDYVTRISALEKRPRSEVLHEVISVIDGKTKDSPLRIV